MGLGSNRRMWPSRILHKNRIWFITIRQRTYGIFSVNNFFWDFKLDIFVLAFFSGILDSGSQSNFARRNSPLRVQ